MALHAVLFDLDGVIADTAMYHYQAWKDLASHIGISIDKKFNEELKGVDRSESLRRILQKGGREKDFTEAEQMQMMDEKNRAYVKLLERVTPKDALPGIPSLFRELKKNKIKIGIASASRNAPMILKKLDLMSYVDAVADPAKVRAGKPAPDIFIEAAKEVEESPRNCIGIEDAPAGVAAIKAAGMRSVAVGTSRELLAAGATVTVKSTSQLTFKFLETVND